MTDEQFDQMMGVLGRIEALLAVQASVPGRPGRGAALAAEAVATIVAESPKAADVVSKVRARPANNY